MFSSTNNELEICKTPRGFASELMQVNSDSSLAEYVNNCLHVIMYSPRLVRPVDMWCNSRLIPKLYVLFL